MGKLTKIGKKHIIAIDVDTIVALEMNTYIFDYDSPMPEGGELPPKKDLPKEEWTTTIHQSHGQYGRQYNVDMTLDEVLTQIYGPEPLPDGLA